MHFLVHILFEEVKKSPNSIVDSRSEQDSHLCNFFFLFSLSLLLKTLSKLFLVGLKIRALVTLDSKLVRDESCPIFLLFAADSILDFLLHLEASDCLEKVAYKVGISIWPRNRFKLRESQTNCCPARVLLDKLVNPLAKDLVEGVWCNFFDLFFLE
jgi:hypothetical protein